MAKAKYTKRADGRYYTTYWDGTYTKDGKKRRVGVYSDKSSADLEKKVNRLKAEVVEKQKTQKPLVLADGAETKDTYLYAKEWLKTYKEKKARNTQEMYTNSIETYIVKLSGIPLCKIRHTHFQFLINQAAAHPRSCEQLHLCFKQIMKAAARDRFYDKSELDDLFEGIELPLYRPKERRALTPEEKEAIGNAPFTDRERTYIYIAYGCGLRRGEILALTPFCLDFRRGIIKVSNAVEFDLNTPYIKDTKNHRIREVPMPDYLKNWLQKCRWKNQKYLISKKDGELMTKSAYDRMWGQIKKKIFETKKKEHFETLEDYDLTSHYFRHNYCASLCYQVPSISIKKIAALLGDTEKMVLEVYNHIIEENEKVDDALKNAVSL